MTNSATTSADFTDESLLLASPAGFAHLSSRGQWKIARHLDLLNRKLLDVAAGKCLRLIVEMPPRHGKSEFISHRFPAWYLGTFPNNRAILTSYSDRLASNWSQKVRDCLSEWGPQFFGVNVDPGSKAKDNWRIQNHDGGMLSAGVGASLTGFGANLLIGDDLVKNAEESLSEVRREAIWDWFISTCYTRLEPNGAVILFMTRWHVDDPVGRLRSRTEETGEEWEIVSLPAIAEEDEYFDGELFRREGEALWPERWPLKKLEQIRKVQGLYWWKSLYQQQPTQHGSAEWPDRYFEDDIWFDEWPDVRPLKSVLTLDPSKGKSSKKGDYSAFVYAALYDLDGKACLYVDADLERRPAEQIVADAVRLHRELAPDGFGCEANGFQELLASMIEKALREAGFPLERVFSITNTGDKLNRIRTLGPMLENGEIRFRRSPGCRLLVKQLKEFPLGKHDDGPDALEMAYQLLSRIVVRPTYERFVGKLVNVA